VPPKKKEKEREPRNNRPRELIFDKSIWRMDNTFNTWGWST
jgi:hypothetical protein